MVWVTDTTELIYGREDKVHLHIILDFENYVLSHFASPTEAAQDTIQALG